MHLSLEMRIRRMNKRITELEQWVAREGLALGDWRLDGLAVAMGTAWQDDGSPRHFFHPTVEIPAHWPLSETRLNLWLGGEGLLHLIGTTTETHGLNPPHQTFPLPGRSFSIKADCVARLEQGVPARNAALTRAEVVWVEEGLADYIRLLHQVVEFTRTLGGHEVEGWGVPNWFPRRPHPDHSAPHAACDPVMTLAEASFHLLDWPTETQAYLRRIQHTPESREIWTLPDLSGPLTPLPETARASVAKARDHLREGLRALQTRFPPEGSLALTGHAHIDLAWLWPMDETRRKAQRTFHTATQLAKAYPEFRFNHSTAQLYDFVGQDDPDLLNQIKALVTKGQWEPIGNMWVEPDTNMPCGESLIRQVLYGAAHFAKLFGTTSTVAWLPDTFGFTPALPQILRQAGLTSVFTIKTNWSELHRLPHDLFDWQGLDGSKVLMHTFDNPANGYNAEIGPRAAIETWRNFVDRETSGESLLCYGHGDGGGGPTEDQILRIRQLADFPVVPKMRHVNVSDWFAQQRADATWVGEIYLEYHRGTLTTQGRTKYMHRRAERALVTAEILQSLTALRGGALPAPITPLWHQLLRNEFHDILPGSSIRQVYETAEAELAEVVAKGKVLQDQALLTLAARHKGPHPGVIAVNPDLQPRALRLTLPTAIPGSQATTDGHILSAPEVLPGLSVTARTTHSAPGPLTVSATHLENAFLRVEIGADGTILGLRDKRTGREALAGRGNQIWAYVDKPRFFDAWDIEEDYTENGRELLAESIAVTETGPHRAAVTVTRRFGASVILQHYRLWSNSARLDIVTQIDWHDRRVLLKSRNPLAIHTNEALFECALGVISRPTHRNTPHDAAKFEVAAHRFALMQERGFGVALLNDGKYGHHVLGNEIGLSLLRSPVYPDLLADEGRQEFTYALLPFSGDWEDSVLPEAQDLNQPLLGLAADVTPGQWQGLAVQGRVALSALKVSEAGDGLILRLYEPGGARVTPALRIEGWQVAGGVDLLEQAAEVRPTLTPFQLASLHLTRS